MEFYVSNKSDLLFVCRLFGTTEFLTCHMIVLLMECKSTCAHAWIAIKYPYVFLEDSLHAFDCSCWMWRLLQYLGGVEPCPIKKISQRGWTIRPIIFVHLKGTFDPNHCKDLMRTRTDDIMFSVLFDNEQLVTCLDSDLWLWPTLDDAVTLDPAPLKAKSKHHHHHQRNPDHCCCTQLPCRLHHLGHRRRVPLGCSSWSCSLWGIQYCPCPLQQCPLGLTRPDRNKNIIIKTIG